MTVREALREDIPSVAAIEEACFAFPYSREQLERELESGHLLLLVSEGEDGSVKGYAGLNHIIDEGYITNVAVEQSSRRQGTADALMAELVSRAKEMKLSFVSLEVRISNAAARSLYEKHGFAACGALKNHYSNPKEDAVIMTLNL